MANASLNIVVVDKRMLKQSEAATYTGLISKTFKAICPVRPIEMRPGVLSWDKRDLDKWIDSKKQGFETSSRDDILGKL
ncbi:MAG: hypothetical protein COB08_011625 [Rhodobacteraceae bacterium]|nr:hypothetical protein [Paracoccaceae bacterium]